MGCLERTLKMISKLKAKAIQYLIRLNPSNIIQGFNLMRRRPLQSPMKQLRKAYKGKKAKKRWLWEQLPILQHWIRQRRPQSPLINNHNHIHYSFSKLGQRAAQRELFLKKELLIWTRCPCSISRITLRARCWSVGRSVFNKEQARSI